VIVLGLHVLDFEVRPAGRHLHVVDGIVVDARDPEQPVLQNAGVEIVDLTGRIRRIREDIESAEAERPVAAATILADVDALYETYVHFERRADF
jgi:hypothetical protein